MKLAQQSRFLKFAIFLVAITLGLYLFSSVVGAGDILHQVSMHASVSSSTAAVSTVLGGSFNTSRQSKKNTFFDAHFQPPALQRDGVVFGRRLENEHSAKHKKKSKHGLDEQLENETKWRFVFLAVAALPTVLVMHHFGNASLRWCSWLKISNVVCILFPILVIIRDMSVLRSTDIKLNCGEDKWKPMIKPIGDMITIRIFGTGRQVSANVRKIFGGLLYVDMLAIVGKHRYPEKKMPTMEQELPKQDLYKRSRYFILRYMVFLATAAAISEVMWFICSRWQTILTWVDRTRNCVLQGWMRCREFQFAKKQKRKKLSASHIGLLEDEAQGKQIEDTNPSELQASDQQIQDQKSQFKENPVQDEQGPTRQESPVVTYNKFKGKDFGDVFHRFFNIWYASYQVFLYLWTDIIVSGGLANVETGTVWEMWSLPIEYVCAVHLLVIIIRYLATLGVTHQHPTILLFPAFLPWIGNELHIWKDHATQGLAFSVAHCVEDKSPSLSGIGLVLGYYGIFANLYSVITLLEDRTCKNGLIMSHFPVAVAAPMASTKSQTPMKSYFMDTLIAMNTKEKQVRAWRGEFPHLLLHCFFIYFFGGSGVIYASLLLSSVKIAMFPLITWFVKLKIETWACSEAAARRYLMNINIYDFEDDPSKPILELAQRLHWHRMLAEFYGRVFYLVHSLGGQVKGDLPHLEEMNLDQMPPCAGDEWMGFTAIGKTGNMENNDCHFGMAGVLPAHVMSRYVDGKGRRWMHIHTKYDSGTWGGLIGNPPTGGSIGDPHGKPDTATIKEPYTIELYDMSVVHLSTSHAPMCWRLNVREGNHVFRLHLFDPWGGGHRKFKLEIWVGVDHVLFSDIITTPPFPKTRFDDITVNVDPGQAFLDVKIANGVGLNWPVICGFEVFKK